MQVFIRTLVGKTIALEVEKNDTFASYKQKIYEKEGILPENQILYFAGKILDDSHCLADYNNQINVIILTRQRPF
jgi:hypothetical protein